MPVSQIDEFGTHRFLPVIALAVGIWAIYYFLIEPLYFSPLAKIPGPKLAALTYWAVEQHHFRETGGPWVRKLHEKYGPIVRISPNEVDIADPKYLNDLYGIRSPFAKPANAAMFQNYGSECSFSAVSRETHRTRRKFVAKFYSMSALVDHSEIINFVRERSAMILAKLEENKGRPLDVFTMATRYALDIVSFSVWGESLNLTGGNNLEVGDHIRTIATTSVAIYRWFFWVTFFTISPFYFLAPAKLQNVLESGARLEKINDEYARRAMDNAKSGENSGMVSFMMNRKEFGSEALSEGNVLAESCDHVLAGADTTGATLTWLFYTLAKPKNRKYQDELREELLSLSTPLNIKEVLNAPYLNRVLLEIQRLFPAGPGAIHQREVGKTDDATFTFDCNHYRLPPGTLAGSYPYILHHLQSIYGEDVENFRPGRWQEEDPAKLQSMHESHIPFNIGARTCVGMNLAIIEAKYLVSEVLRSYSVELPSSIDPLEMKPVWGGVLRPQGESCTLRFKKL